MKTIVEQATLRHLSVDLRDFLNYRRSLVMILLQPAEVQTRCAEHVLASGLLPLPLGQILPNLHCSNLGLPIDLGFVGIFDVDETGMNGLCPSRACKVLCCLDPLQAVTVSLSAAGSNDLTKTCAVSYIHLSPLCLIVPTLHAHDPACQFADQAPQPGAWLDKQLMKCILC